jgi:ABC-type multidrug transport system permease subunit
VNNKELNNGLLNTVAYLIWFFSAAYVTGWLFNHFNAFLAIFFVFGNLAALAWVLINKGKDKNDTI